MQNLCFVHWYGKINLNKFRVKCIYDFVSINWIENFYTIDIISCQTHDNIYFDMMKFCRTPLFHAFTRSSVRYVYISMNLLLVIFNNLLNTIITKLINVETILLHVDYLNGFQLIAILNQNEKQNIETDIKSWVQPSSKLNILMFIFR